MNRFRRLLTALAGTDADSGLLRYAAAVARLGTATEVRFVHVLPPDADASTRWKLENEVKAHFANVPASIVRPVDFVSGPLLDQLLEHAAATQADVLFLGHRRAHPGKWALARRLAMKAPCSVWMVPDASPTTFARFLVPVDFSAPSTDALQVATSLARLTGGSECVGLHVYFNEAISSFDEYERVRRGEEQEAFAKFTAPLDLHGIAVVPLCEESVNAAHAINRVAVARQCDLIVMATRGRSRSASILLGSVTEETIAETTVPLLVVKHYGAHIGFFRALWDKTVHHPNKTHF